jgi:hypothetical protein
LSKTRLLAGLCSSATLLLILALPARASFTYDGRSPVDNASSPRDLLGHSDDESPLAGWISDDHSLAAPSSGNAADVSAADPAAGSDDATTSTATSTGSSTAASTAPVATLTSEDIQPVPITTSSTAPEPATCALIGFGLMAIPFARKALKKRA